MNHPILNMPGRLDLENALAFAREVAALPDNVPIVELNFSAWPNRRAGELPLKPFGMLVVSQALQHYKRRAPGVVIMPLLPPNEIEGYAAHMGFLQACDVPLGNQPGQAKGSNTYLPIIRRERTEFRDSYDIDDVALDLSKRLTQQEGGELVRTLTFSFSEIIRNVIEHSQSSEFWYCAQYWPSQKMAEIALIDQGIGLRASLLKNPHVKDLLTRDEEVLKYALWPGVSGKRWGTMLASAGERDNSGYGLYMNYRICNEGGDFFIASGSKGLYREMGADNQYRGYYLPGVALRLRLHVDALVHFEEHKDRFLAEGARQAREIEGGILPTGDKMSQMLRTGFSRDTEDA